MDLPQWFKRKKVAPQNVVQRLIFRETFAYKKPGTHFHTARKFYQTIFPNYTVINVEKPPCFLRKFSPDGKYFIAFSSDQMSLEVYTYQGPAAAADLFHATDNGMDEAERRSEISRCIFERMFKLKYAISVTQGPEELNRECSLFSDDGRYVIIGSATFIPEEIRPHFYEIYTNNESVTPNPRSPLENYTLYLVDLQLGKLCDTRQFRVDKIFLSHNQGLYLYKDVLAVLSVQHQVIHVYQILDGMFVDVRNIGRFCFEDDTYFYNRVYPTERAFRDVTINSLKHRLLAFLYKRAQGISQRDKTPLEVRKFFHHFGSFHSLKLWKMQLLDENHLLIKYASEDVVTLKCTADANTQPSFFVVYNMTDTKVLAIYENTSSELLTLFENFCDSFRNTSVNSEIQLTCSPSNNIYARILQQRFKQTITSAKYGGEVEATKRLLSQLPISAQSYSCSPYLDLSLFSYDDKWVSVMERPKTCGEYPIRFYGRDSGFLKFQIIAGAKLLYPPTRRLVAFTFHPSDPFAISVQRTNTNYVVNFHIRQDPAFESLNPNPSDDLILVR